MTRVMKPKVSVVTPLHNKGKYIAETVASVLSQSFTDWEMIVVENGSTDSGPDMVRNIGDPRVRLVVSEKTGPSVARNLGIAASAGEWIQFLDADDLLLPGHLQKMAEAAQASPKAGLITCDWLEGPEPPDAACKRKRPTNRPERKHWRQSAIAFTPWVVHAAWIKRSALGAEPWWDESFDAMPTSEDHVFWFKVLQECETAYSPHAGVYYRIDTRGRRHDLADTDRYATTVDASIEANLKILQSRGMQPDYRQRRSLLVSYVQLGIADYRNPETRRGIQRRIAQFRPPFGEALQRRDLFVLACHVLPTAWLGRLQKARQAKAVNS